jgi:hypothetical protein
MVEHLDLLLGLYDDARPGELKENKRQRIDKTFDEANAFYSYGMYVNFMYNGPDDAENLAGLQRIKHTKSKIFGCGAT